MGMAKTYARTHAAFMHTYTRTHARTYNYARTHSHTKHLWPLEARVRSKCKCKRIPAMRAKNTPARAAVDPQIRPICRGDFVPTVYLYN
jgi:hypothetical protein